MAPTQSTLKQRLQEAIDTLQKAGTTAPAEIKVSKRDSLEKIAFNYFLLNIGDNVKKGMACLTPANEQYYKLVGDDKVKDCERQKLKAAYAKVQDDIHKLVFEPKKAESSESASSSDSASSERKRKKNPATEKPNKKQKKKLDMTTPVCEASEDQCMKRLQQLGYDRDSDDEFESSDDVKPARGGAKTPVGEATEAMVCKRLKEGFGYEIEEVSDSD